MDLGGIKMIISTNPTTHARERSQSHPDGQDPWLGTRPILGCSSPSIDDLGSRRLGIATRTRRRPPFAISNRQTRPRRPLPYFRSISRVGAGDDKIPIITGLPDPIRIGIWSIHRVAPVFLARQGDEPLRWISEFIGNNDRIWDWQ